MNFVLPIQKNPQREIADFILNMDISSEIDLDDVSTINSTEPISSQELTSNGSGQAGEI